MKAIVYHQYGPAELLRQEEVPTPQINSNEVLVQVKASSVNPVDWKVRRGDLKILTGRKFPKIPGCDFAGVIKEAGISVRDYQVGDEVYGYVNAFKGGAYAQFVKCKTSSLALKPKNLSFTQTATLPCAALTAYQSLVDLGHLKKEHKVLINGCSGGVGSFGVQIAKALGATVTGVCSTKNEALALQLGADEVIDYKQQKIQEHGGKYHIFLDAVANQSFSGVKMLLEKNGIYITTLPDFTNMVLGPFLNLLGSKKIKKVMVQGRSDHLSILTRLCEEYKIIPVIYREFNWNDVVEAHTYSEQSRTVGKIPLIIE